MKTETQYFNLYAWLGKKKTKIGFAYYQEKTDSIRLKADPHVDSTKIGRALLKGDILIEKQTPRRSAIGSPENPTPTAATDNYSCHADEQDKARDAEELKATRAAQNAEVR